MKFPTLPSLNQLEETLHSQAPTILTTVGVAGTLTTAVMTAQAAASATRMIDRQETVFQEQLEFKDKFLLTWKCYIPPVVVGGLTVVAIVGANRIGVRRAAGIAAAYSLAERAHTEYKDEVRKTLGEEKEQKVRDRVAQERVSRSPGSTEVIISGTDVLCYEAYTGRYFKSSVETLKKAQNDLNYKVLNEGSASLAEFYDLIGLPQTDYSDLVGWQYDRILDLEFSTVLSEDQRPCLSFSFHHEPTRGYHKLG